MNFCGLCTVTRLNTINVYTFDFLAQCLLQTLKNTSKSIRWLLLNLRDNSQVTALPLLSSQLLTN